MPENMTRKEKIEEALKKIRGMMDDVSAKLKRANGIRKLMKEAKTTDEKIDAMMQFYLFMSDNTIEMLEAGRDKTKGQIAQLIAFSKMPEPKASSCEGCEKRQQPQGLN